YVWIDLSQFATEHKTHRAYIQEACGSFDGSLKDVPAPALGGCGDRCRSLSEPGFTRTRWKRLSWRQCRAGRHQDESRWASGRPCRSACHGPGAHSQPTLRLRCTGLTRPRISFREVWGYRMGDGALYDSVLRDRFK